MRGERLTDDTASNWVDRGESPEPALTRVLVRYLSPEGPGVLTAEQLEMHVLAIRGMVEGDASEVQLTGYLKGIEREAQAPEVPNVSRRTTAIALWHIVKSAEVRDRARRLIEHGVRTGAPLGLPPNPA